MKAYFVTKGIDEDRLTAKGYGDPTSPIDPGLKTQARRGAKNRRVEFKLIAGAGAPDEEPPAPAPAPAPEKAPEKAPSGGGGGAGGGGDPLSQRVD